MLFGRENIERALGVKIIVDTELERNQRIWRSMLDGKAEWNTDEVPSLHLASSICREVANNATFEKKIVFNGNKILAEQFNRSVKSMHEVVSLLTGHGSLVLKPFVRNDRILMTIATPDRRFPIEYNELGELTSVAFSDSINTAEDFYTLLESHAWDEATHNYTIKYKAFHSKEKDSFGIEIPVSSVLLWANLQDLEWKNIPQPLFIECNMPKKQAIFANAVNLIRSADEQYGRILWEFEGGELAIDASIDLFKPTGKIKQDGTREVELPKGKERLFRLNEGNRDEKIKPFSPPYRDNSLYNGLNNHKREIEFACAISYSVISDPSNQDKTATEIRSAKQRFLITVRTIQEIVEESYKKLAESMNILGSLYGLFPMEKYEISFEFGDSVLEDPDTEYQRRKEMVAMGLLKPEEFFAWYFEIDDIEEALKRMPTAQTQSIE